MELRVCPLKRVQYRTRGATQSGCGIREAAFHPCRTRLNRPVSAVQTRERPSDAPSSARNADILNTRMYFRLSDGALRTLRVEANATGRSVPGLFRKRAGAMLLDSDPRFSVNAEMCGRHFGVHVSNHMLVRLRQFATAQDVPTQEPPQTALGLHAASTSRACTSSSAAKKTRQSELAHTRQEERTTRRRAWIHAHIRNFGSREVCGLGQRACIRWQVRRPAVLEHLDQAARYLRGECRCARLRRWIDKRATKTLAGAALTNAKTTSTGSKPKK